MLNNNFISYQDIYEKYLSSIKGIKFTPREIDIISFVINGRSYKKIANFLSLSPRTIENNIQKIMLKLNCNSKEGILDFIENSEINSSINQYYKLSLVDKEFKKQLEQISYLQFEKTPYTVIYWEIDDDISISHFCNYIRSIGVPVSFEKCTSFSVEYFIQKCQENKHNIYILPKINMEEFFNDFSEKIKNDSSYFQKKQGEKNIFLFSSQNDFSFFLDKFENFKIIDLNLHKNYYSIILDILKKTLISVNLNKLIKNLNDNYDYLNEYIPVKTVKKEDLLFSTSLINNYKKILFYFIASISILGTGFLVYKQLMMKEILSIRSDLNILPKAIFLPRPELISQIDDSFQKEANYIQTLALVGPGGAGKTTLAKQYGFKQKANIVWEINAETIDSLRNSFEILCQLLAKTKEDQKKLKEIQEIKNIDEKEKEIIFFVRDHLKIYSNWFLIFDNVEKFVDIQKYFPSNADIWGNGRVLLTTRNANIQNNKYVNYLIKIKELKSQEKFDLFSKIINCKLDHNFTVIQNEKIKIFLKEIPPFPLDICIAAYYLKSTNISYEAYLQKLNKNNKNFLNMQRNILEEAGNYTKTRYSIINLSLGSLINEHKDFKNLLLFICLLDSQNIPKEILFQYKEEAIIDKFIYQLKKYSFITSESSFFSDSNSSFSIHRSTQTIILDHLTKLMDLEKNNNLLDFATYSLENYLVNIINEENLLEMNNITDHCKAFLKHENILSSIFKKNIENKLAGIYYYLGNVIKAKEILEKNLLNLNIDLSENLLEKAWSLGFLGAIHRSLGDSEKAKNLLEQSLAIYKKYPSKNDFRIAWTLRYLGDSFRNLGNYEKAKNFLKQSLLIYKKQCSEKHIGVARALGYLGVIYHTLGDYKKAKNFLEESFMIHVKYFPTNYLGIAWSSAHLSDTYIELGEYKKANFYLNKSLTTCQKYSNSHTYIAWVLARLGVVCTKLHDYKSAKDFFKKSLALYEKKHYKNSVESAWVLLYFGQAYMQEGNIIDAEILINESLSMFHQYKYPSMYISLESLAEIYLRKYEVQKKKDLEESLYLKNKAIEYLNQAKKIVEAHFPLNSPHAKRIQLKLKKFE